MPIHEYKCKDCGNEFDLLVFHDEELYVKCKRCGSTNLSKEISLTNFNLKGKGWAKDGYSKK